MRLNSIAFMSPKPPKEALALTAAMRTNGVSNAAVARHMGVTDGLVSQWRMGRRPVPAEHAARLAKFVGVSDPREISSAYARVQVGEFGNVVPLRPLSQADDQRRLDLVIARLENDVDSLRYAIAGMTTIMAVHRPAEARDVAKMIRKHVPAKFANQGFLAELLKALDAGG